PRMFIAALRRPSEISARQHMGRATRSLWSVSPAGGLAAGLGRLDEAVWYGTTWPINRPHALASRTIYRQKSLNRSGASSVKRTVCWSGPRPLFVGKKAQVEIWIGVPKTAPGVPELGCCGGTPLVRIPQTWLRFGGAFCLTAAATCPALGAAAPSAKGLSTASTWRLRMSLIAKPITVTVTELSGRRHPAV